MAEKVLVETSARHIHLTDAQVEILFGAGATLTCKKELSQPGQFVCEERVTLVGPKKSIPGVVILGPTRPAGQVEISLTDARTLGVDVPVRESGKVDGTPAIKLVGPAGELEMEQGLIAAMRHLHTNPRDAEKLGVSDKQIVSLKIESDRTTIFGDVLVRVNPDFNTAIHIDTDEANAASAGFPCYGEIIV